MSVNASSAFEEGEVSKALTLLEKVNSLQTAVRNLANIQSVIGRAYQDAGLIRIPILNDDFTGVVYPKQVTEQRQQPEHFNGAPMLTREAAAEQDAVEEIPSRRHQ